MVPELGRARRTALGLLVVGLFVWGCGHGDSGLQVPTQPSRVDYAYQGACPYPYTCRPMASKERQQIKAAIIQIGNDCPELGNALWDLYDSNRIGVYDYDDHATNAWTWYGNSAATDTVGIWSGRFGTTLNDDLINTLRHEGGHHQYGWGTDPDHTATERYALLAENTCTF